MCWCPGAGGGGHWMGWHDTRCSARRRGWCIVRRVVRNCVRVSSPPNNQVLMDPSLPVFSAKVVDWSQEWRASRVEIVRENERLAPSEFSCSEDRDVFIGEARYYEKCNRMKRLHEDGRITETRSTCLLYTIKINISLQVYEDVLL